MIENPFLIKLFSKRVLLHLLFWTLFIGFYSIGFYDKPITAERFLFEFVFVILIYLFLVYSVLYFVYDYLFKKRQFVLAIIVYVSIVIISSQGHAECFKYLNDYDISFLNFLPFFFFLSILVLSLKIFRAMFFELKKEKEIPKSIEKDRFIELKKNKSYIKIRPSEVLFIESKGNNVHLFLKNGGEESVYNTLKIVSKMFPKENFIQVHRSFVVNSNHISGLIKGFVIVGEHKIPIGKSYEEQLDKVF